jgi:hypothetical protein
MLAISSLVLMLVMAKGTFAQSFEITWDGGYGSGSGNFSASNLGGGTFLLTSIIGGGTQAGDPISLQGVPGYAGNDNNLFFPGTSGFLDYEGFSIADGTSGYFYNIYYSGGTYHECNSNVDDGCSTGAGVILSSFTVTPTPEPSTILLFLSGFGVLLILAGRRVTA